MKEFRKNEQNDNPESIWDTIVIVIELVLSVGLLIGLIGFIIYLIIAPFLNNTLQDLYFVIAILIFYGIVNIVGEGVLSLFE